VKEKRTDKWGKGEKECSRVKEDTDRETEEIEIDIYLEKGR